MAVTAAVSPRSLPQSSTGRFEVTRVLVPDQRGHNASGKPADLEAYGLEELENDIVGLLDTLGAGLLHEEPEETTRLLVEFFSR